jgi:hypothetical protein
MHGGRVQAVRGTDHELRKLAQTQNASARNSGRSKGEKEAALPFIR